MPVIECRVLGPVGVWVDGAAPPSELMWRKHLALLIYLARSPKRARTRDHLTALLWGDKSEASARHSLREALRVVRRTIGEEGLTAAHDQVRLAQDAVRLDTDTFERAEREMDWEAAGRLVAGDFLEGFGVPDASAFEDWVAAERTQWRDRAAAALVAWAQQLTARGQLRDARAAGARALALAPLADRAVRVTMTALALDGDRSAALAHFARFRGALGVAGGEPAAETLELADRIRGERTWRFAPELLAGSAGGAVTRRAPLVGRERELERLLTVWHACVRERQAAAVVVEGDPGLGKTRLMEELLARARLGGAAVTAVRAVEADHATTWSGLFGLGRGGLLDAAGLAAAAPQALRTFAEEIPEWADRFGRTVPHRSPLPPGAALSDVLRAATLEQPVVAFVDDAQWLDPESAGALTAALRDVRAAPFLLALAVPRQPPRSDLDELRARIGRDVPGVGLALAPLDAAAVRRLAAWAAPNYGEDDLNRLARRVAADAAGLPLLVVELLHAVALGMDLGAITGAWPQPLKTLDQTLPGELPDAAVAAIRVGFGRLSKGAQHVLVAAAVLGDRVPEERLGRGAELTGTALHAALDELEWQRWLVAEPRGYGFVAKIVRDIVARDMLTAGQRQRIVQRAGGARDAGEP